MPSATNRAMLYRNLAEECRRLAETTLSTQMRNRYSRMAESYVILAEAEGEGHIGLRRLAASMAAATPRRDRARSFQPVLRPVSAWRSGAGVCPVVSPTHTFSKI